VRSCFRDDRKLPSTRVLVVSSLVLLPRAASASNFGDFPSVVPFLLFTPFFCVLVGWLSSIKRTEDGRPDGIDRGRFLVASLLAVPAWLALCLVAFLATL